MTDRSDVLEVIEYAYGILRRPMVVCEVGVYRGEAAEFFCASTMVASYIGVDPWRNGYDPSDATSGDNLDLARMEAFRRIGISRNASILQMQFGEACAFIPPDYVDLFFIDASHKYEDVYHDIMLASTLVAEDGVVAGHDYVAGWPGVVRAVDEVTRGKAVTWPSSHWAWRLAVSKA